MRTGQKIAALVLTVVVLAGGVGAAIVSTSAGSGNPDGGRAASGPLLIRPAHGWAAPAEVGETFVDGTEQLFTTQGEATLVKVEIEGDSAISLVGSRVAGSTREFASVQYLDSWPVTDPGLGPIASSEGAVFSTREADAKGIELLVAMKLEKPGHFLRKGLWITYEADGVTHRDFIPAELTMCSADFVVDGECPFLGQGAD